MQVFKFGGASVKDAKGVCNLVDIISKEQGDLIVVISAMGKVTNAFEKLINAYFSNQDFSSEFQFIVDYHREIIQDLNVQACLFDEYLALLETELQKQVSDNYNFEYDRLIGFGELFSTIIVWVYIRENFGGVSWIDIREIIKTDSNYRFAKVDWEQTIQLINQKIDFSRKRIYLTQGFIASDLQGNSTSLGREGSDYSAAILAYACSAESISIWKDVPGVLNADPRLFENPELLSELSFYDAIELVFFGAQIIHPKTIQPLKNKKIPLKVRSFLEPEKEGTLVSQNRVSIKSPIVIIKEHQVLLSIKTRDFSFVDERNLALIFSILSEANAKINMMQNGAVSFSVVVDFMPRSFDAMLKKISSNFDVKYNSNLKLITIRHYTKKKIDELLKDSKIYLEQKSRNTAQYLINEVF